ncbi:MAG TPA: class I SAM-dependent methyltransferase [Vicinamibacterales bacterium]|nr:class I SAM-dependent methyltransferase [Vicinamibacterales bacterium]
MLSDLLKWGGKRPEQSGAAADVRGDEPAVPSKALPKFLTALTNRESPVLLDFGPVLGSNVAFFGERLGCKLFIEDLVSEYARHVAAGTTKTLPDVFASRFRHEDGTVDGVLCWDFFDFLDKPAAAALAQQILRMLRPGGAVMGFFCTASVAHAPFTKYEIVDDKTLRHRAHSGPGAAKHVLQNRDIIRMFDGLIVSDSFLLKSNTREILLRRR